MNLVRFPGIGLEFYISRVAFQIGSLVVYKYAVCIVLRNSFGTNISSI